MSAIDVERARAETPGVAHTAHLNNCGAALMPTPVLQAVKGHLDLESRIGGYEAEDAAAERLEGVYTSIARLLNAAPDEIAIVENATVAWDMAFYGMRFRPGDRIVTVMSEYASNYIAYLQVAKRTGAEIVVAPNDESGQTDVEALARLVDERVKLVSATHVPTNGGLVNPAAGIGKVARDAGVPFLLDACQSAGQMPLDVQAIGCDMLTATGRKFLRGPRGTGFLYVRRAMLDRLEPPFLDLRAADWTGRDEYRMRPDARRFENWENYVAGRLGLGAAVDYALAWGLDAIEARVTALAERIRAGLAAIPGVTVRDLGRRRCGIVSFTVDGRSPEAVAAACKAAGIAISTSSILGTRLEMEARDLPILNRLGVHYYNSEEELERLLAVAAGL